MIDICCVVAEARAAEPRGGPAGGGTRACQARGTRHLVFKTPQGQLK